MVTYAHSGQLKLLELVERDLGSLEGKSVAQAETILKDIIKSSYEVLPKGTEDFLNMVFTGERSVTIVDQNKLNLYIARIKAFVEII